MTPRTILITQLFLAATAQASDLQILQQTKKAELLEVSSVSIQSSKKTSTADKVILSISAKIESNLCELQNPTLSVGMVPGTSQLAVYATGDSLGSFLDVDGCTDVSIPKNVQIATGVALPAWEQGKDLLLTCAYGSKTATIHLSRDDQGKIAASLSR